MDAGGNSSSPQLSLTSFTEAGSTVNESVTTLDSTSNPTSNPSNEPTTTPTVLQELNNINQPLQINPPLQQPPVATPHQGVLGTLVATSHNVKWYTNHATVRSDINGPHSHREFVIKSITGERIKRGNGWVTTEQEIPVAQLSRLVLEDEDVLDILHRCLADRYPLPRAAAPQRIIQISRVVGEISVSRSIGDRDFKAPRGEVTGR